MLLIAWPRSRATESTRILPQLARSGVIGIVFVTISSSSADRSMRPIAGPDSTPCTAQPSTRAAPSSFSACAAFSIVPAVSMMSSWMMQVRPLTSPMTFITSGVLSSPRRLSTTANSPPSRFAYARARSAPPASGATMVRSG